MNGFISYVVLGLSLSAPIGPINAAQLDRGIKHGFLYAWLVGIGAMVADALFMLLIYFGVAHFLSTPFMRTFLWSFGCFILIYIGIESIRSAQTHVSGEIRKEESAAKSFWAGFAMALSNPLNILFWLGIYGSVLAQTTQSFGGGQMLLYSGGIFLGILLWDVIMAGISSTVSHLFKPGVLRGISVAAGISLLVFGLYFGYRAVDMIIL
ncbi:LysE family transporter [Marinicrinis sediminis]|uniref:LysE family transporter n=1 Tax=Marinicrinis sediminis TaxID=1652465 RepID=A0ABW5RDJ4_9BACL